jgi:CheY-like chemotaxis protein/HPt (histidine-containing phosphotransfer) domain-containing protein
MESTFEGKVMFVDDDPLILRLCSLILSKNKIQHVTFQDPELCLAADVDETITHVFLDIRMPSMNGVELCQALRKKYSGRTRFIALTAHVLKEERDSILQEGFDTILPKPFRESDLIETLKNSTTKVKLPAATPDLSALRQMTLNDESLFQSVLLQFVDETTDDIKTLKAVLASHDTRVGREVVHRLSGRLSQIGIGNFGSRFAALESQIVGGKSVEDLEDELREMVKRVEELIAQLRLTTLEHLN